MHRCAFLPYLMWKQNDGSRVQVSILKQTWQQTLTFEPWIKLRPLLLLLLLVFFLLSLVLTVLGMLSVLLNWLTTPWRWGHKKNLLCQSKPRVEPLPNCKYTFFAALSCSFQYLLNCCECLLVGPGRFHQPAAESDEESGRREYISIQWMNKSMTFLVGWQMNPRLKLTVQLSAVRLQMVSFL